jgi:hypothetical protein
MSPKEEMKAMRAKWKPVGSDGVWTMRRGEISMDKIVLYTNFSPDNTGSSEDTRGYSRWWPGSKKTRYSNRQLSLRYED